MTNRFPLVMDGGALKELPSGDDLKGVKRIVQIQLVDPGSAITAANDVAHFIVPSELNGALLKRVHLSTPKTVSSSGLPTVMLVRERAGTQNNLLSTALSCDVSEKFSTTAATAAVIDATYSTLATDDIISVNITIAGTGTRGLVLTMVFDFV